MSNLRANTISRPEEAVSLILDRLGKHWVAGVPLGLGKPNHLVNTLYRAACADDSIQFELYTALSLNPPKPAQGLKQRFLEPFLQRQFGDYPRLDYLADLDRGAVPGNIRISEFYFRSGTRLNDLHAQQHYLSSNYTHVARDMQARGVNLLLQMVARDPGRPGFFSLSCNPDVTLDLLDRVPRDQLMILFQVNDDLPYMGGDAEVPADLADIILDGVPQPLFAVPRMPISDQDMLIGLYASQLIRDQGTLQLGIGSLGDAVSFCTLLRHRDNEIYQQMLQAAEASKRAPTAMIRDWGGTQPFRQGLYAASEMFAEGFLHLYRGGVLKRRVYDHTGLQNLLNQGLIEPELKADCLEILWQQQVLPRQLHPQVLEEFQHFGVLLKNLRIETDTIRFDDGTTITNDMSRAENRALVAEKSLGRSLKNGSLLHAAFFLGSGWMYQQLREMPEAERELFRMTAVSRINQLYGSEALDRAQRLESRFINTTMKMTLLGAAVSDQLEDGQVVSGVGGQYNFVAMAQALDRSRSILMLRSHRSHGDRAVSNIVWEYPHATIPRHLRDIVITEYGIADLRSAEDHEVIQSLICIADSRWQESLRHQAVVAGKLAAEWRVPDTFRNNSPEFVRSSLQQLRQKRLVSDYPFGSDFTETEEELARALSWLQNHAHGRLDRLKLVLRSLGPGGSFDARHQAHMMRMGLETTGSIGEKRDKRLLGLGLRSTGST